MPLRLPIRHRKVALLWLGAAVGALAAAAPLVADPASTAVPPAAAAPDVAAPGDTSLPLLRRGGQDLVADPTPAVLAAVDAAGGVPLADGSACAPDQVRASYEEPGDGWTTGAHVSPLVAPDFVRTAISGIALCEGSHHAYVGFEAVHTDAGWVVQLVPDPAGGIGDGAEEHEANSPDEDPAPAAPPIVVGADTRLVGLLDGPGIEGYAAYEGQSTCDPTAKPGTVALRNLLLTRYPMSTSLGISRACAVGGRSEHKEGRALDWGVNVGNPAQRAAAEAFIGDLLATDSYGHRHALARRMGIMYVIWNGRIWSAYQADAGWRTYTGSSPHTDHVHLSMSWAGARGQTSFWSGTVVPGLPDRPLASVAGSTTASRPRTATTPTTAAPRRSTRLTGTTSTVAPTPTTVRRRTSVTSTTLAAPRVTTTTAPRIRVTTTTTARPTTTTTARPTTTTTSRPTTTTTMLRATTTTTVRATTTTTVRATTTTTVRATTTTTVRATTTTTGRATTTTTVAVPKVAVTQP